MQAAFSQSARAHRIHLTLRKDPNSTTTKSSYYVCTFCGFIMEGDAPDKCPICTAPADRFKRT